MRSQSIVVDHAALREVWLELRAKRQLANPSFVGPIQLPVVDAPTKRQNKRNLTPEQLESKRRTWLSLQAAEQLANPSFVGPVRLPALKDIERRRLGGARSRSAPTSTAKDFGRTEMNQSSELYQTPIRAVLYALMDLQAQKDLDDVLKGLEQNLKPGAFYSSRDMLVTIARFIGKKVDTMRPEEASAARVLADGIENQRM